MRATQLLCEAIDGREDRGEHRCFYCGAACDGSRKSDVKPTFTEWSVVVCPSSPYRCRGCELAMREKIDMPGRDKPQKSRTYSWLITGSGAHPMSKADMARIRSACTDPPPPPFALAIAASGQKHILYRSIVSTDAAAPVVNLEGENIQYAPAELFDRLELAKWLVAATGKPALNESPSLNLSIRLIDTYADQGVELFNQWRAVWNEPLSRLAAHVCPNKKECQDERIPPDLEGEPQHPEPGLFPA